MMIDLVQEPAAINNEYIFVENVNISQNDGFNIFEKRRKYKYMHNWNRSSCLTQERVHEMLKCLFTTETNWLCMHSCFTW